MKHRSKARPCLVAALLVFGACMQGDGDPAPPASRSGTIQGSPDSETPAESEAPNVLVVVTDDMRVDGLQAMPFTVKWLVRGGRTFTSAFATTPLCCPSRASIFTGLYSHNHGVLKNKDSHDLDTARTIQARLQRETDYRTAIVGKYLNSWSVEEDPPHFDRWASYSGRYYGKPFNIDGVATPTTDYSTYHMADRAVQILEDFEGSDAAPWFLYVATVAPHTPFTIPPNHKAAKVPVLGRARIGLETPVAEKDVSDKPDFTPRSFALERPGELRRKQWRTLLSVDDLMRRLRVTLGRLEEARDTLVIFTSDQGLLQGEHGLFAKRLPYTESIQVPMLARWPGRIEPGADDRIVANVDVAPTIMEVAGISSPDEVDGVSLLSTVEPRTELFIEQLDNWRVGLPDWRSIRTPDYQYVQYYSRGGKVIAREYYDLRADPWQHDNLLGDEDPGNDPDTELLATRIEAYRECTGASCRHAP